MEHIELVVFGLLVAVAGLVLIADKLEVPYPILLVLGGLVLGFAPGVRGLHIELEPELVLVLFLPPLLYSAAFFSSLRDLRANIRPIGLLAVGLVLLTAVAVAAVAHWVIGLPWAVAFVLGGILSPTDPVAATAIAQRLGVPRRIVTLLEGESLVNDASALVLFRIALVVAGGAAFSFLDLGYRFVVGVAIGVGIGLLVGWIIVAVRRRVEDPLVEITITLFTGYAAYLPAEELNNSEILPASAVLAAVTVGIYVGWRNPSLTSPRTRLQAFSVWETVTFLLNSLLFILVGLQLPAILEELSDENLSLATLALYGALVSLAVILARFLWVFPATYVPRWLSPRLRERDPSPPWQNVMVISYAGMRGAVSLAAALAVPESIAARDLILFLTFCVILVTVVGQGLTLQPLIRWLDIHDDGASEREEIKARLVAAEAALDRIDELAEEGWVREDTAERMRGLYGYRRRRFVARHVGSYEDGEEDLEERSSDFQRFRRELLEAERAAVLRMRSEGKIGDEAMRNVERDLDLEDARLEI
ncbi:Na+/H+ antiporter [Rubrobacter marinus]|uniref:Na+/H+ antiporter n=1 Tax=Rubrobacter marinus TaxID=2653852 RepID=A0A6G8PYN6_9ACTN|nr:Na+/H+ antiporter [Rubrobacter marinus]QIN79306.1 Na+/H+ antiporter [Rubrobacter marinus]